MTSATVDPSWKSHQITGLCLRVAHFEDRVALCSGLLDGRDVLRWWLLLAVFRGEATGKGGTDAVKDTKEHAEDLA